MDGAVAWPRPAAEARPLVVGEGLLQLAARIHHEGAMLRDGLADGLALKDKHLAGLFAGFEHELGVGDHHNGSVGALGVRADCERFPSEKINGPEGFGTRRRR